MLILKYFLVVGAALTVGLLALNAHLTSSVSVAPVRAATTTAPPPPVADPEPVTAAAPAASPPAPAKAASHTRRSKAAKRHSGVTAR